MESTKANNFDLVRLAAALQVASHHSMAHLNVVNAGGPLIALTDLFPGVPVFFFISGFLISRSYERSVALRDYALNRVLRIYPALVVCLIVSLLLVASTGYLSRVSAGAPTVISWIAAQLTIFQFYNPDFLRGYGIGVLNGSLWTITVELQFYLLVPVVYSALRITRRSLRDSNLILLTLLALCMGLNLWFVHAAGQHSEELWYKLLGVSFLPWFYMFLAGVLAQRNFPVFHRMLAGRFWIVLAIYAGAAWLALRVGNFEFGNNVNPLLFSGMCLLALSAAFSRPTLSDTLLRRNDISYGVYIYHMPVVNFLLAVGLSKTTTSLVIAMTATIALAFLSWIVVERPALRLKRRAVYDHQVAQNVA